MPVAVFGCHSGVLNWNGLGSPCLPGRTRGSSWEAVGQFLGAVRSLFPEPCPPAQELLGKGQGLWMHLLLHPDPRWEMQERALKQDLPHAPGWAGHGQAHAVSTALSAAGSAVPPGHSPGPVAAAAVTGVGWWPIPYPKNSSGQQSAGAGLSGARLPAHTGEQGHILGRGPRGRAPWRRRGNSSRGRGVSPCPSSALTPAAGVGGPAQAGSGSFLPGPARALGARRGGRAEAAGTAAGTHSRRPSSVGDSAGRGVHYRDHELLEVI